MSTHPAWCAPAHPYSSPGLHLAHVGFTVHNRTGISLVVLQGPDEPATAVLDLVDVDPNGEELDEGGHVDLVFDGGEAATLAAWFTEAARLLGGTPAVPDPRVPLVWCADYDHLAEVLASPVSPLPGVTLVGPRAVTLDGPDRGLSPFPGTGTPASDLGLSQGHASDLQCPRGPAPFVHMSAVGGEVW